MCFTWNKQQIMSEITNNRPNDNIQTPVIFDIKFAGTLRYFRTILELMTLLVLRAWRHSPHGQILSPRLYYTDREIEGTFYFQGYVIDPGSRLSCIPHTDISPSPPPFRYVLRTREMSVLSSSCTGIPHCHNMYGNACLILY